MYSTASAFINTSKNTIENAHCPIIDCNVFGQIFFNNIQTFVVEGLMLK